jgi:hypothetical protein
VVLFAAGEDYSFNGTFGFIELMDLMYRWELFPFPYSFRDKNGFF